MTKRMLHVVLVLIFGAVAVLPAAEFTIGARTLVVPDGYEVELVAGAPLVERPIAVARDERGRLYVTDSGGLTDKAEKQLAEKPHRIFRLADTDGDGKYDKQTLFADKMMFPEGCLWYEGSLYVAAPPQIWKLTDTNDDGTADERTVWFDGKTLTGCANDLHGPYLGHDGWFYWCKGAFAEQKYTLPKGKPMTTRSSHIFRSRPDGSQIEPVLTGGMDNPVNVAFASTGERFLSCTFFQYPAAGRRDGLIHAIYGGIYGKKHDSIFEHQQTGDVMPVLVHEGAAAPCGLWAGSDALFGGGHLDNLFACYFNLHKVVRHKLVANGPTFKTEDEDFVSCDHVDFHPTDVFEDADGSLLVVDTGGWYKVCCPTSQLAKPDVLGGIYRVRRKGQAAVADPLGTKLDWASTTPQQLADRLADSRLFVQQRVTRELRRLGVPAIAPLQGLIETHADAAVRRRAVWTLAAIDDPAARAAERVALKDRDASVRQVAAHAAGLWRDGKATSDLLAIILNDEAKVARPAAEAIGRIGDRRAIPTILQAIERLEKYAPADGGGSADAAQRITEHALVYALIEIGDPAATAAGLKVSSVQARRAALVALDQMDGGNLQAEQVIDLLDDVDPILRRTAEWIVGHRPQWGEPLVAFYTRQLAQPPQADEARAELATQLARLAKSPAIQQLLVAQLQSDRSATTQQVALAAMSSAGLTATPPAWLDALAALLPAAQEATLVQGVTAARQWPMPKGGHAAIKQALLNVGLRGDVPRAVQLDALQAAGPLAAMDPALFDMLVSTLRPDEPMAERNAAATILGTANLSTEQLAAMVAGLKDVGPIDLPRLLPAFERKPSDALGLQLVDALRGSQGIRGLRVDLVKPLLAKYSTKVQEAGQPLLAELNASAAQQAAHLDRLMSDLQPGDVARGHQLFTGKKAACINCHTLGYNGGRLGPDLTNIGKVRNERDLVEAIVYPSASFVRGYEPMIVALDDGRMATGIIVKESRDEIVLALDPTKTQHIARREIEEIQPAQVSLMPQGMGNILTAQELADLVAFLRAAKR